MSVHSKYCEIATNLCNAPLEHFYICDQVFSAYSSHNPEIVNQIEAAIKQLDKTTNVRWISWKKDMDIENALIFCEICKHIYQSKAVLIELSDLNFNVLFEYGYSLGLGNATPAYEGDEDGERDDYKMSNRVISLSFSYFFGQ